MIVWTRIKAMEGDNQIDVLEGPHWGMVKHGVKIEHTGVRRALFCESKRNILMRVWTRAMSMDCGRFDQEKERWSWCRSSWAGRQGHWQDEQNFAWWWGTGKGLHIGGKVSRTLYKRADLSNSWAWPHLAFWYSHSIFGMSSTSWKEFVSEPQYCLLSSGFLSLWSLLEVSAQKPVVGNQNKKSKSVGLNLFRSLLRNLQRSSTVYFHHIHSIWLFLICGRPFIQDYTPWFSEKH